MTYVVLNGVTGLVKLATRGKLIPADYEEREYWTCETLPPLLLKFSREKTSMLTNSTA